MTRTTTDPLTAGEAYGRLLARTPTHRLYQDLIDRPLIPEPGALLIGEAAVELDRANGSEPFALPPSWCIDLVAHHGGDITFDDALALADRLGAALHITHNGRHRADAMGRRDRLYTVTFDPQWRRPWARPPAWPARFDAEADADDP